MIKLVRVTEGFDPSLLDEFPADYHLLEGEKRTVAGGTGETFAWEKAAALKGNSKVIVSGGLKPENVAEAVTSLEPGGVDVSSGVEKELGIKDHRKVKEFIEAARGAAG